MTEDREGAAVSGPDEERTFTALPPARGRAFARTWWGQRWLKALEETALEAGPLRQGRRYARQGAVGAVSVRPGRLTAVVRGGDGTAHRADVLWRRMGEAEWERLLEVVAGEAGHLAALLDRDVPPRLVADAADAGVELLPGVGDLDAECGCEAWDHCPHTAALCYQVARILDEDPFVLLLLRGRSERALLDLLAARAPTRDAEAAAAEDEGVPAWEAFSLGAVLPPLPAAAPPPAEADAPPALEGGTAPAPGVDVEALGVLASDAAVRARRLLQEALAPGHAASTPAAPLTEWEDAVRWAAGRAGAGLAARLAAGCGRTRGQLEAAVRAWGCGGAAALAVLEGTWSPGPEELARAREQIEHAWADAGEGERPQLRAAGARWSVAGTGLQLRLGPEGRWWPYRWQDGAWCPAGRAEADPAAALSAARDGAGDGWSEG